MDYVTTSINFSADFPHRYIIMAITVCSSTPDSPSIPFIGVDIIFVARLEINISFSEEHEDVSLCNLLLELVVLQQPADLKVVGVRLDYVRCHLGRDLDPVVQVSNPEHHAVMMMSQYSIKSQVVCNDDVIV